MSLPTDEEIFMAAEELGLLDENGQVPRERRTHLAAVVMATRDLPDDHDEPELTTAQALSRFHNEMVAQKFISTEVTTAIYEHVLPALITRDGLIVKESRTP